MNIEESPSKGETLKQIGQLNSRKKVEIITKDTFYGDRMTETAEIFIDTL